MLTQCHSLNLCANHRTDGLNQLNQLKHLYCNIGTDVSQLTKTNIHFHYHNDGGGYNNQDSHGRLIYDHNDRYQGCLIRHHDY